MYLITNISYNLKTIRKIEKKSYNCQIFANRILICKALFCKKYITTQSRLISQSSESTYLIQLSRIFNQGYDYLQSINMSIDISFLITLVLLAHAGILTALFRFMRLAIFLLEKSLDEVECAMKKIAQAAEDMSYTLTLIAYDIPLTFDAIKLASREFEVFGRDFNKIIETLTGRRQMMKKRKVQYSSLNKLSNASNKSSSANINKSMVSGHSKNGGVTSLVVKTIGIITEATRKTISTWDHANSLARLMTERLKVRRKVELSQKHQSWLNTGLAKRWGEKWSLKNELIA